MTALVLSGSYTSSVLLALALVAVGVVLARPWSAVHGSIAHRGATVLVLAFALVVPTLLARAHAPPGRRIGVTLERATAAAGDPTVEGGIARIATVVPASPAAGLLFVGDRIIAVGGHPLAASDPVRDVVDRVASSELPVDTTVDVLRDGHRTSVGLHVPWPAGETGPSRLDRLRAVVGEHLFVALALRGVCLIAMVVLLLRSNGQNVRQIGLRREGALRECALGVPGAFGAFVTNVLVAIPIGIVGLLAQKALERDIKSRAEGLSVLVGPGSTSVAVLGGFAVTAVFAASFEEVVFRGFFVPRLRHATGSAALAIVLASVAFASGHLYEGVAALVQTFALGVFFCALLLRRGRLESAIVAHTTFNIVMFAMIAAVRQSGLLR